MFRFIPLDPSKEAHDNKPFHVFNTIVDLVAGLRKKENPGAAKYFEGQIIFCQHLNKRWIPFKQAREMGQLLKTLDLNTVERVHLYRTGWFFVNPPVGYKPPPQLPPSTNPS